MRKHKITAYLPGSVPAYVANGCIGLRLGRNPWQGGTAFVDGYFGMHEVERIESLEAAPYPFHGDIGVNGLRLGERPDLLVFREQSYDFSCGELSTRFEFPANGVTACVEVVVFCSRTQPTLALEETRVTVDQPCALSLRAGLDPAGLPGRCIHRLVPNTGWRVADGSLLIESQGALTHCGGAYITEFSGDERVQLKRDFWGYRNAVGTEFAVAAEPGREYVLRRYVSLVAGPAHAQPDQEAIRLARIGQHIGFENLRRDNRDAWTELWKGRICLLGADDRWQDMTDAAFFYLHASSHFASWHSTPCFGLGHRNYFGMILWDTTLFSFPTVLLSAPRTARSFLDHHSRTLDAARRNAALSGYDGLLFGNGGRLGEETVPSWAAGVFAEQHFNLAVARAFAQYVYATGDLLFAQRQAWPVLEGVADWVVSRVTRTSRGYEIRHITGPDEGIENIHNNAYTNLVACEVLREAATLAARLNYPVPPRWLEVAAGMVLPIDPATRALKKHDDFVYTGGMFNPETLLAFFPWGIKPPADVLDATLAHDLDLAPTYIGQPMFTPFFAVLAARRGQRDFAAELLEGGVAGYVADPFLAYAEYKPASGVERAVPPAPYMATMGAFLLSCVYGFGGLELGAAAPESWGQYPVAMPAQWDGIEVERIWVRGRPAHLVARHGDARATIIPGE